MIPTKRRSPWLVALLGVLAIAAAFFVARHASEARRLADQAGSLDLRFAAVGMLLSVSAIANRGLLNRAAHRAVGLDTGTGAMTRTAAVGFTAQKMVKSAGAAGLAVFVRDGRRRGHEPGAVAAACVLTAVSSFVALGILLVSAIAVLVLTDRMTGWWIAAVTGFGLYTVVVVAIGFAVVRNRTVAVRLWSWGQRTWCRLTGRSPARQTQAVPDHLFDALDRALTHRGALGSLLLHGVASKALGALMLIAALSSVGVPVSASGAVVVYATALGASMVTIVPGGVGTVEGSTAALLVASGASLAAATLAVVLFRFFDLLVPVCIGAVAARRRDEPAPTPVESLPQLVESLPEPVALVAAA